MNWLIMDPDGLGGPSVGAIATALSFAGNREVISFGKPSREYFTRALEILGIENPADVYMVSDDPFTDLAGGKKNMGLKTVFVLSGKYKMGAMLEEVEPELKPDWVFSHVGECSVLLERGVK